MVCPQNGTAVCPKRVKLKQYRYVNIGLGCEGAGVETPAVTQGNNEKQIVVSRGLAKLFECRQYVYVYVCADDDACILAGDAGFGADVGGPMYSYT